MGAYEIITAEKLSAAELAKLIDHSLLFAYTTKEEILKFCGEVKEYGFGCAAINPRFIELVAKELKGTDTHIDAPIGYPWGANLIETKVAEIYSCVRLGATDVDYVISVGAAVGGDWDYIKREAEAMVKAAQLAMEDRKPAQVFIGSAETEGLNWVRRYFMDDGSLSGDNTTGTGTKLVSHESEADGQLQLMKFVRDGGKDILVANFQCHPHLEGKTTNLSAQVVGTFRDAAEKGRDLHCLYWQGASGNLNSSSYIEGETRTRDRVEWGQLLWGYADAVYDSLTPVATGPVKVTSVTFEGKVNHEFDKYAAEASGVWAVFSETNDHKKAMSYAEGTPISSVYHANRIVGNCGLEDTKNMELAAWSFGDVSGVVVPYEMFDTNGMEIKTGTPFAMTFIISYAYPAYMGYIASELAWTNGGYECDNSVYVRGTAEELVSAYLGMLNELKG